MEMTASDRLRGQVFLIMGGTGGLGASAARAIVRAGARALLIGRNPDKAAAMERELGESIRVHLGDACAPDTAEQAVELAMNTWDRVDGLYHVAGGSGRRWGDGPLDALSDEGWNKTLEWNLASIFYSNRAVVRSLLKQGGGSIVNCGSVLGFAPAPTHFSTHAYAAAKAGIIGLTRSCAAYYAPHNVRFNVLAPALVATPMSERAQQNPEILNFIRSKQPLEGGRIGLPEDLDGALVWLLSDESRYVTGQVLAVDGGWSVSG